MRPSNLTKEQRGLLVAWAAEGFDLLEINERAAKSDPPFKVTQIQLRHVRERESLKFREMREAFEREAITEGLARKAVRIRRLAQLAEKLEADLLHGTRLWVEEPKQVGAQIVDVEKFNAAEVKEYRGLLDDIAREIGDRRTKVEISGKIDVTKLSDEELNAIVNAEGESGA